jgi:hypothetical protein
MDGRRTTHDEDQLPASIVSEPRPQLGRSAASGVEIVSEDTAEGDAGVPAAATVKDQTNERGDVVVHTLTTRQGLTSDVERSLPAFRAEDGAHGGDAREHDKEGHPRMVTDEASCGPFVRDHFVAVGSRRAARAASCVRALHGLELTPCPTGTKLAVSARCTLEGRFCTAVREILSKWGHRRPGRGYEYVWN